MDIQYQLKAGSYYLYDMRDTPSAVTGERRFKLKTDTVAIAFDVHTGEVHQHGSPTRIQSWATMTRRRLRAGFGLQRCGACGVMKGMASQRAAGHHQLLRTERCQSLLHRHGARQNTP